MSNYSILSNNLKRGLVRFSERISAGLSRPDFKFVSQMIYGMLSTLPPERRAKSGYLSWYRAKAHDADYELEKRG